MPSQTELLYDLGLRQQVIGITKFCIHPEEWFRTKTRVGGTKQLHLQKIKELQPDLIIANKEENVREQIENLAVEFPVWISDINDLDDALSMIASVGEMTGTAPIANAINDSIRSGFDELKVPFSGRSAAYLIWKGPYMAAGGSTFINDMLGRAGFANVFANRPRYPEVDEEELAAAHPEILMLSSEPFPFEEKHVEELRSSLPHSTIILVDGEMFSWYGSRLRLAAGYLKSLRNGLEVRG